MKNKLTYYFFFSVLVGSVIYVCEKTEIILPNIIRFYVNDFLIIPIVLTIVLWIVRAVQGNSKGTISILNILYLCVLYAVLFEYWLPKFHNRYTADSIDVLLYFNSGILFYVLQKTSN